MTFGFSLKLFRVVNFCVKTSKNSFRIVAFLIDAPTCIFAVLPKISILSFRQTLWFSISMREGCWRDFQLHKTELGELSNMLVYRWLSRLIYYGSDKIHVISYKKKKIGATQHQKAAFEISKVAAFFFYF